METTSRMYYRQPARAWTEALPLGNGRIGAMAWFGVPSDRVDLNEDTLWSGYPHGSAEAADPQGALRRARAALARDDYAEAQRIIESDFTSHFSQAYLPLGALKIDFAHEDTAKNYVRYLDLDTGVAGCEYEVGGVSYRREMFVSHPAQAFVYRLTAGEAGKVSCTIALSSLLRTRVVAEDEGRTTEGRPYASVSRARTEDATENHGRPYARGALVMDGECPVRNRPRYACDERETIYCDEAEKRGMGFEARCEIAVTGGSAVFAGEECVVTGADEVEIRLVARTSFAGAFRHPHLEGAAYKVACLRDADAAAEKSYAELKDAHCADFSALMGRVKFALDKPEGEDKPTDKRLLRFQETRNDPALYELIFNFGRYLMISASRPGTQAMNLQGIWNDLLTPPWNSNYTININTEMNYWPAETCALSEMTEPLTEKIEQLRLSGEETARKFYGARGSVSHHNTDIWAMTNPVGSRIPGCAVWAYWQMSFGWLCRHLYDHYLFTLDRDFLRKRALPCLKAAARFYLDVLTDVDGELTISPATSPENSFLIGDETRSVARAAAMSDAIVREVFDELRAACKALGEGDEMLAEIDAVYPRLRALRVGADGRLLEWDREYAEKEPRHRHTSHLYALHPAHLITPERTPELAEACRKTLLARGDDGTGWSLGWKINFWARLNDGDHALTLLKNQLRFVPSAGAGERYHGGGTYLNLFDAHPPFQIDGNFGATAGIQEMLMRTEPDSLYLLPALPGEWQAGEITGLTAMYDTRVSIRFDGGRLTRAVIQARQTPPQPVRVVVEGKTRLVIDRAGSYEIEGGSETCS